MNPRTIVATAAAIVATTVGGVAAVSRLPPSPVRFGCSVRMPDGRVFTLVVRPDGGEFRDTEECTEEVMLLHAWRNRKATDGGEREAP